MRIKILFMAVVIASAFSACTMISALHPLSENEKDFIFKKDLIGKWGKMNDSSVFYNIDTVAGTGGKLYRTEIVDLQEDNIYDTSWFLIRVIKISDWYFLDCYLDFEKEFNYKEKKEDYEKSLISKHFFCKIKFPNSDKLQIIYPDADELMKLIDQKKILLNYSELKKDDYLILNKSAQLRKGLAESKKYPFLYKEKDVLIRLK